MVRKFGFLVLVLATIVVSCGRQVTPNRTSAQGSGLPSGFMLIKYTVNNGFDFNNVRYDVVFNTTGTGTPYALLSAGYSNYSLGFIVGNNLGSLTPSGCTGTCVAVVQYLPQPGGGAPRVLPLLYTPQQLQFNPNSNGLGTEFSITFSRALAFGIGTPSPTATPTPTPVPTATPTPTATPSASPSGSPTPSPTPSSLPSQGTWYFNFFTTDVNNNPIDAIGANGIQDVSFSQALDTTTVFDLTQPVTGQQQVNPPQAQIYAWEIANTP